MDRQALEHELAQLKVHRKKRVDSNSPHQAAIAMIDERVAEIGRLLSAPVIELPDPV